MMGLEKINEYKKQLGLTNKEISERSGVPLSTVSKIMAGFSSNPRLETLKAIADVLRCSVEDFTDTAPESEYYVDRQVSQMAQEIYDNPELRILFDASRKLSKEDVLAVVSIVKRMKGYND